MQHMIETIEHYTPINEQERIDRQQMLTFLRAYPDALHRSNPFGHLTTSGWIINETHDKVLMIYHNLYDSWGWVGGHNDGEGNALHVALKEAFEETSNPTIQPLVSTPISLETLPVWGHMKKGAYVSSHLHFNVTYLLVASEHAPIEIKEDENSGVAWFTFEEALQNVKEATMHPIYQKLIDYVKALPRP